MKPFKLVLLFFALSLITSSCYKRNGWGVRGQGDNVTETRPVSNFESISLSVDGDVEYTQDSIYRFEITGQANILALTNVEVRSGDLKIFFKGNVWDHNTLKIKVYGPKMKGLEISGSGNITATNRVTSDAMLCNISGSGNIQIPQLQAKDFSANISGSGNISIDGGTVTTENLLISGSGNINCGNFVCQKSVCRISGSGNITTHVTDDLNVTISGSGDVRYRGKPIVNTQISGSGNLIHIE